jgi:hypothetical protein
MAQHSHDFVDPAGVAEIAFQLCQQDRRAWSFEVEARPNRETWLTGSPILLNAPDPKTFCGVKMLYISLVLIAGGGAANVCIVASKFSSRRGRPLGQ